jgi:uncharacterized protein YlxW (UPF0749 family)
MYSFIKGQPGLCETVIHVQRWRTVMKKLRFYVILGLLMLQSTHGYAQSNEKHDSDQAKIVALEQEVARLKEELSHLKTEIQQLRRLLATQTPSVINSKSQGTSAGTVQESTAETGYWCTKSSNKRHNPSCRYYKTSNGRPCGPSDGIPCKLCGG